MHSNDPRTATTEIYCAELVDDLRDPSPLEPRASAQSLLLDAIQIRIINHTTGHSLAKDDRAILLEILSAIRRHGRA